MQQNHPIRFSLLVILVLVAGHAPWAQNLIKNGDFEVTGGAAWTPWMRGEGKPDTLPDFEYTGGLPTGSYGKALYIGGESFGGSGAYQAVVLTGGHVVQFEALAKLAPASSIEQAWIEVWIGTAKPTDGEDYNDFSGAIRLMGISSWDGVTAFDGALSKSSQGDGSFIVPGDGDQVYYLMIRAGGDPGWGIIDNISAVDLGLSSTPAPNVFQNAGGEAVTNGALSDHDDNSIFENPDRPRVLFFHYSGMQLSNDLRYWLYVGNGSALNRRANIREVEVTKNIDLIERYHVFRAPTLLVVDKSNREITRIHYDGDYNKFCRDIAAATGIPLAQFPDLPQ